MHNVISYAKISFLLLNNKKIKDILIHLLSNTVLKFMIKLI